MRRIFFGRNLILLLCFLLACGCAATKTTTKPAATTKPAVTSPAPKSVILYVATDKVNLRECPSSKCKVAAVLKLGDEVIKLGQEGDWINIRVKATNGEGWVAASLVGKTPKKKTPPRIVEEKSPRTKDTQGSTELKEEFAP